MGNPTRITVVLCTYNRAHSLAKTLESVAAQTLAPSVGWEILVVDNNSSDETRQVVDDFRRRYPERFRYLFEPQQGLCYARNAGIRDSRGEILAFIDDDETADKEWLQNLTANLQSGEWAGAGGRILPQWNCSRPPWLLSKSPFTSAPLVMFDLGLDAGQLNEPPFGANMAFKKEMFQKYGGFRPDLDRVGESMLSGGDTEFGRRLMVAGQRLRYEPSAVTYHPAEPIRVTQKYFLTWWFNKGRSDIREFGIQPDGKRLLGMRLRLFRDAAVEVVRWMVAFRSSPRFICKLKVWTYAGQAYESYHQSLDMKRKGSQRNANVCPPAEGSR